MNQFFLNPEEIIRLNTQEELAHEISNNNDIVSDFLNKADFLLSQIRDSQALVDKVVFGMRAGLDTQENYVRCLVKNFQAQLQQTTKEEVVGDEIAGTAAKYRDLVEK